ncbi:MAG: ribulose-phosphate 3-epimerase [Candidatus Lokiarchaeota archaeon]|nr:ribulose-phosphate 3-epimerase [Candidatus Lokiarchaeota archaeon]
MKKVAVALHAIENVNLDLIKKLINLDFIHIDVMDGIFVNNTMLNLELFKTIKENFKIPIIAHLMVKNPIDYIQKIIQYVDVFFFHIEAEDSTNLVIKELKKYKKGIGLVLNPPTPIIKIVPFLEDIDFILVMGVNPGWSGQKFIPETIEKVNKISKYKDKFSFEIDVDGGVNLENGKLLINADILSSSSTILNAIDPNKVINSIKNLT